MIAFISRPECRSTGAAVIALLFIFLILSTLILQQARADQPDSRGTDFWVLFTQNLGSPDLKLFIAGDTATTGTVDVPGIGFSEVFSVTPGVVTTVDVPTAAHISVVDSVQERGIHITSEDEITVYGLNRVPFTTDAFLGLPTDILGTNHVNVGYGGSFGSQFGIVASEDNTTVTITPTVSASGRTAGVPYPVQLDQGNAYQLRAGGDLSGTRIVSDKPVAVFGGHNCANIPANFSFCDHIVEQLPPVSTWGTAFVTFPLATRTGGDTFRITASEDVTSVQIDGGTVATLNSGEYYESILVAPSRITSDKPVLVTQYSNGTQYDNVTSDPFQVVVPPFEQFLSGYTITTPASGFSSNFVSIVAPDSAVGAVTLDGVAIPAVDYTAIGSTGFSGVAVPVTLGSHQLDSPVPFGLTVYGFDSFDSYGYPGGLALAEVASLTDLSLNPPTATNPVNTEHCVTATNQDQNGDPIVGIRVDFSVSGANTASSFEFSDASGDAQYCYTGTNAGTDAIVASVGNLNATASKEWTLDEPELACDVNNDEIVDRLDLNLIAAARNTIAGPGDPLDIDGSGIIDVNDVRQCTLQCTLPRCQTP